VSYKVSYDGAKPQRASGDEPSVGLGLGDDPPKNPRLGRGSQKLYPTLAPIVHGNVKGVNLGNLS